MTLETLNYNTDSGADAIKKLDRNQRALKNQVENVSVEVIDNLTSMDIDKPLSARQGKVLDDKIILLQDDVSDMNDVGIEGSLANKINNCSADGGLVTAENLNNIALKQGFYSVSNTVATTVLGTTQSYGYEVIVSAYNKNSYASQIWIRNVVNEVYSRQYNGTTWTWKPIATTEKTDISNAFLNGWSNYGNGYMGAMVEKNGNKITCSGIIKSGTLTAGTYLFKLPTGFIPSTRQITFMVSTTGTLVALDVQTNGNVQIPFTVTLANWFSLNTFEIEL
ncbi:hypothetical protein CS063_00095 [Sporanaerobium hydrogeniformans]|uniref:Uncharacterized protein n=1 Tax=Sporanaerobium hydrogeniformans TaxID=3072179 RepID=A0AC61DHA0_9FIRM|nr:pyocin knob domain-containing protein [Sporanaerobium hydrogeniformans]PHV71917.1 hypothetical protein CS063_00095 [Sporanaerobium hydrogeniformans]